MGLALAKPLVDGRYHLKPNPYDGLEKFLAAYNVSENAIDIIRQSVDVVEVKVDDEGGLTLSQLPGVDVARVPEKVSITSKPGMVVDYQNPLTGEDSNFSWVMMSPLSMVTKVEGKMSGLVEINTWTFSHFGVQRLMTLTKGGRYLARAHGWWERVTKE